MSLGRFHALTGVLSIKYRYSDILCKNLNVIYSILRVVVTVCYAAIKLVIVLSWFL